MATPPMLDALSKTVYQLANNVAISSTTVVQAKNFFRGFCME